MEASRGREQDGRKRRRRRRRRPPTTAAALLIWVILIFAQFSLSSALTHHLHQETVQHHPYHHFTTPVRKVGFFEKTAPFQAPRTFVSGKGPQHEEDQDRVYGDDKRLVHTGPNPLHN